jgi:hypothetical protein
LSFGFGSFSLICRWVHHLQTTFRFLEEMSQRCIVIKPNVG